MTEVLMQTVIITAELISAIFLAIIFAGYYSTLKEDLNTTKYFRYCILATLPG